MMPVRLRHELARPVDAACLAAFRAVFGAVLFMGILRLLAKGYVREAFVVPRVFFPPWPFEEVLTPLPGWAMHGVYGALALLALAISVGLFTRAASGVFCVLFTYAHFLDLTNYLNHYWMVTCLTALMSVTKTGGTLSLDARLWPAQRRDFVPAWTLYLFRFQVGLVYFFAGAAKLRPDWLVLAQPMRIWLAANTDIAIIGPLLRQAWVAHAASIMGAAYDLTIPAWLLWSRSRPYAYAAVVVFHLFTARLFNIGMFPYFMMAASLLFLAPSWPRRFFPRASASLPSPAPSKVPLVPLALYALLQLLLPLRSHLYGGNVLWHEQGYRFAWRVMLMEKMGSAEFTVVDRATGTRKNIRVRDHLTSSQEKAMATQPDMILAFARYLARVENAHGRDVAVHADVLVVLNGRRAARLVDSSVDLGREHDGFGPKSWILPAPDDEK